jgi:putative hydrolase of the HAD superfamily
VPKRVTWVFDLDNTLHDAQPHIMPHINRSMTEYVQRVAGVGAEEAGALRRGYWKRYGATLIGMMRHHAVDPHHFLAETHRFPDLSRMLVAEAGLRHALRRLRGRKIIFSNAPANYAEKVLELMRIRDLFDAVYCIENTRFRPKPALEGFIRVLRAERAVPERCVMIEDMLDNLRAAKRLGMKTVWVTRETRAPAWLDVRIPSVLHLPRLADNLTRT